MPFAEEHSCRLKEPTSIKGASGVYRSKNEDGSVLIAYYWGNIKKPTKVTTQAKRYPTDKFSKEQARKDCTRLKGKFEPAKQ